LVVAPSATVPGPLSVIARTRSEERRVGNVGITTVAALDKINEKFSGPSTKRSCEAAIVKLNSAAAVARSEPLVFVAVTVIAPVVALVLKFDNEIPDAALSPACSSAAKSAPSVAVPDALSTVNVTFCPAPSPTPLRLTV